MGDWRAILRDAVGERWKKERVFFIAQVKPVLKAHNVDLDPLLEGRQVGAFLKSEMPELQQIQHELEPTNWGLVPADAKVEYPYSQYFAASARKAPRSDYPYQNALRVALSKPLPEDQTRWLSFNPVRFVDLPNGSTPPDGITVPRNVIEPDATIDRLSHTTENFLREAGLDPNALKVGQTRVVPPTRGRSALHQLLALIPKADLPRVSLPLDLVQYLIDQTDEPHR